MSINQQFSFAGVRKCLSDLKKHFEDFCKDEFNKINPKGKKGFVSVHSNKQSTYCM